MHGSADEEGRRYLLEGGLTVEAVDGRSAIPRLHDGLAGDLAIREFADPGREHSGSIVVLAGDLIGDLVLALDDPLKRVGHSAAHDALPKRTDFVLSPNRARPTGRIVDVNRDRLRTVGIEAGEQLRIVLLVRPSTSNFVMVVIARSS